MRTKSHICRTQKKQRHDYTLLLIAVLLAFASTGNDCDPDLTTEKRITAVYAIANDTMMLTTTGGDRWQNFPNARTDRDTVITGFVAPLSIAEKGLIVYATWRVMARDALGGSSQDKIHVLALPGDPSRSIKVRDGGDNTEPSLVTHNDKLFCFWISEQGLAWASSVNGRTWVAPKFLAFPANRNLRKMDTAYFNTSQIVLAGIYNSGGNDSVWFGVLDVAANGNMSWGLTHDLWAGQPGPIPILSEGISIASDGTVVSIGFARDHRTVFTTNINNLTTWGTPFTLKDHTTAAGVVRPGTKPVIAYLDGRFYAAFMDTGSIRWRYRETDGTWNTARFHVDSGVTVGAGGPGTYSINAPMGVDITVNQVITSN